MGLQRFFIPWVFAFYHAGSSATFLELIEPPVAPLSLFERYSEFCIGAAQITCYSTEPEQEQKYGVFLAFHGVLSATTTRF
eukprot:712286-Amphidinium_carterae.1